MARPGFVLDVDERTPPLLRLAGASIDRHRFALGTKVLYPPDAEPSISPVGLIDRALDTPLDSEPLAARMQPHHKLTIVVTSDVSLRPKMRFDVRRTIVERVLELAARVGVHDVHIVVASGLRRSWDPAKLTHTLGERVVASFVPDHLISNHDVTSDDLVEVAEVDGHSVKLNARIAESDVVVIAGLRVGANQPCLLATSATDQDTINKMLGFGARPEFRHAVCEALDRAIPAFAVIAVAGQPYFGNRLSFLNEREWEWRARDHVSLMAVRQTLEVLPTRTAHRVCGSASADYAILDVVGGDLHACQEEATRSWVAANTVPMPRRADVVLSSAFGPMFEDHDPEGTPLSAAHHVLVNRVGNGDYRLARDGGVVMAWHPLVARFPHRAQSASADFFATVLPETTDCAEIHARFEPQAMNDDWYIRLYRDHYADHPLHIFHEWYRTAEASAKLGGVIWIGGNRDSAAIMGHRAATTYADALEISREYVGADPWVLYSHEPGMAVGRFQ